MKNATTSEYDWCRINWKVKAYRDRLKLITDVENTGRIPIENLSMRLRFNSSVMRRMDIYRMRFNHLLPGSSVRFSTRLEARREFDEAELILKVNSRVGEEQHNLEISLGKYSLELPKRNRIN
jgi:hypothetical protein